MDVIIDTNILYYISNLYDSKYNATLLLKFLKERYDTILISDFTILEMNTKFYNDHDKIIYLINFMHQNNIGVHLNLTPEHRIIDENTIKELVNIEFLNKHIETSFMKRKEIEISYLSYFISAISSLYLSTKIKEQNITNVSEDFNESLFYFFYESTINGGETRCKISDILIKKYANGKDKEFNDSIIELIVDNCIELYFLLELSKENINIVDALSNKLSKEQQIKYQELQNKTEFNRLQKRKQKERSLVRNECTDILKNNLSHFEERLSTKIPSTQIKYFVNLFSDILLTKENVIRKNDILDSLMASNYPEKIFLTADSILQKRIIRIYPEYQKLLQETICKCEKKII